MAEIETRMQQLGVTPELLREWQEQEDEEFVGAGLGSLHDLARYAEKCEALRQTTTLAMPRTDEEPVSSLTPVANKPD